MAKQKLISNIVNEEEYKDKAGLTIDTISDTLMKSLGYFGSTTIFDDGVERFVTKDGYNILKNIRFQDTIATSILNFIKEVSLSLVKSVGDGSTSSVISARAMFNELNKRLNDRNDLGKYSRKEISDSLNKMKDLINKKINEKAVTIDENNFDKLKNIATVSNNNDEDLGSLVYEIFSEIGKDGFIFPEISSTDKDHYSLTKGIETNFALLENKFINDKENHVMDFSNPYIVVVNDKLTKDDIDWCMSIAGYIKPYTGKGLVFVAPSFSKEFINWVLGNIHANRNKGGLEAYNADFEMAASVYYSDEERIEDLAIYTNATLVNKKTLTDDEFYHEFAKNIIDADKPHQLDKQLFVDKLLGRVERFTIDNFKTQMINGAGVGTKLLKDRISEINNEVLYYKDMSSNEAISEITKLQKRANSLNSSIAKLYVGGSSSAEKYSRKYLIEDSIHASKSALNHGYISGGNLAVSKAIKNINKDNLSDIDNLVLELIDYSSREVYFKVLENYNKFEKHEIDSMIRTCVEKDSILNIKTGEMEDDKDTDIINSAETDTKILETTISIIGLISLSNQFLNKSIIVPQD